MTDRPSFWRRSHDWPLGGQLAFAFLVILIGALVAGGLSSAIHGSSSTPPVPVSDTTTTSSAVPGSTTSTTATEAPTSESTTRTSMTDGPTTTAVHPSPALVPLTIATASHQDTYNRAVDFGAFIDVDHDCQNSRAEVLIRTSQAPVTFTTTKNCTVKTGRWTDPWSGVTTTVAHDFQIDHTVPLANAWRSGAWTWTKTQRVAYANDLVDVDHLVPILAAENESKSDDGPDQWRPPSRTAWCRYALDWDHIKAKWHLTVTPPEWAAVREMAATC